MCLWNDANTTYCSRNCIYMELGVCAGVCIGAGCVQACAITVPTVCAGTARTMRSWSWWQKALTLLSSYLSVGFRLQIGLAEICQCLLGITLRKAWMVSWKGNVGQGLALLSCFRVDFRWEKSVSWSFIGRWCVWPLQLLHPLVNETVRNAEFKFNLILLLTAVTSYILWYTHNIHVQELLSIRVGI